jgi:hypothetical protein
MGGDGGDRWLEHCGGISIYLVPQGREQCGEGPIELEAPSSPPPAHDFVDGDGIFGPDTASGVDIEILEGNGAQVSSLQLLQALQVGLDGPGEPDPLEVGVEIHRPVSPQR